MCKAGILQKLIELCSRHGYIHPAMDLGRSGVKGCYDFGPLGAVLRRNIQNEWWMSVVTSQEDMFGVESSQLQTTTDRNSNSTDNLPANSNDHRRLDDIPKTFENSPVSTGALSLLHGENKGPGVVEMTSENKVDERNSEWSLRNSLHEGTFAQYYSTLQLVSRRLPFGLAQIGRCFRRMGQSEGPIDGDQDRYIFDVPEFTQMTAQFYCSPKLADRWMIDWQRDRLQWWRKRSYSKRSTPSDGPSCGNTRFPLQTGLRLDPKYADCNSFAPLTEDEAVDLEKATMGQANCMHWFDTREKRLTASLFGKVMKRKKTVNAALLNSLFCTNSKADRSPAVIYGKNHEAEAREVFVDQHPHLHVHGCGFVVNPEFSFLGASPDGKVCDGGQTGILEIKCPYSARGMSVGEAVTMIPHFYMVKSGVDGGALSLKKDHDYYYQVQGQLMVTGAPFCDFVVFTDRDIYVERILPDRVLWESMLDKLAAFYQAHAIPFFIK